MQLLLAGGFAYMLLPGDGVAGTAKEKSWQEVRNELLATGKVLRSHYADMTCRLSLRACVTDRPTGGHQQIHCECHHQERVRVRCICCMESGVSMFVLCVLAATLVSPYSSKSGVLTRLSARYDELQQTV